jgi:hypothetical protein
VRSRRGSAVFDTRSNKQSNKRKRPAGINSLDSDEAVIAAAADQGWDEFSADDYARYCGYGPEIVSSLEKLILEYPNSFNRKSTMDRIARIKRDDKLLLKVSIPAEPQAP